jgi:hypothetical protein
MRRLALLLLVAGTVLPCFASRRVTVERLEQLIAAAHGKTDADVAERLSGLELIERLSEAEADRLRASLPGVKSQLTLVAIADASAFLSPPAQEIVSAPGPDNAAQRRMLNLAVDYAGKALSRLPNFFATRETSLFMDAPVRAAYGTLAIFQSLEPAAQSSATVLYRDGKQVVNAGGTNGDKPGSVGVGSVEVGLITSGEFGPMLGTVLSDAAQGTVAWSRWEQGDHGQEAVFRYTVPKEKSHYDVKFCCVSMKGGRSVFQRLSGYHGEIAIDPETGTILRLTMQADLKPAYPMARADLMVEYGPVEIGGKTYTCPQRSIAIARGYEPEPPVGHADAGPLNFGGMLGSQSAPDPTASVPEVLQTLLNHVVFREYHLFRSDLRIVNDDEAEPVGDPPASTPAPAPAAAPNH